MSARDETGWFDAFSLFPHYPLSTVNSWLTPAKLVACAQTVLADARIAVVKLNEYGVLN